MNPLLWVPLFDGRGLTPPFLAWHAERFRRLHAGVGHIVADLPGPWPSCAATAAATGAEWHYTGARRLSKTVRPSAITVEIAVPTGVQDEALKVLERAQRIGSVSRIIFMRPNGSQLDRIATAISTVRDAWNASVWLDYASFGWDALSYLLARDAELEPIGVPDGELGRLVDLAELLGRPLLMTDFSGHPPHPIPALPNFDDVTGAVKALKSLPIWSNSR